jgi:hypothetical protein
MTDIESKIRARIAELEKSTHCNRPVNGSISSFVLARIYLKNEGQIRAYKQVLKWMDEK